LPEQIISVASSKPHAALKGGMAHRHVLHVGEADNNGKPALHGAALFGYDEVGL
jgi:hypothetical protein